jgi:hypothetical protein
MQNEMENLEWNQKKLQERFQMAVKECKMMEMLLAELEEEHDIAIAKIENLEGKVNILYPMFLPCNLYIYFIVKVQRLYF